MRRQQCCSSNSGSNGSGGISSCSRLFTEASNSIVRQKSHMKNKNKCTARIIRLFIVGKCII